MPWRPIFQLVDHRTRCLGHDAGRVRAELGSVIPLTPAAWNEILGMRRPVPMGPVRTRLVAEGR